MRKRKSVDLRELFQRLQVQLESRLETNRSMLEHPTALGDSSELNWLGMLHDYLPRRYAVARGFIVDHEGSISDFIDLVIFDRHFSPLVFTQDNALYVPAESVYGAFEVKQELNSTTLQYSGRKAASVRKLKRTSAPIVHAGGVADPREPIRILTGVLALKGSWKSPLQKALPPHLKKLTPLEKLDLGCALQDGSFETVDTPDGGEILEVSGKKVALVFFFVRLLARLQAVGSVPAMDLNIYSKVFRVVGRSSLRKPS